MLSLYSWLLRALVPLVLARLAWRSVRNPDYRRRIPERFGFIRRLEDGRVIWVHAVSVGEARAAAPLVKALARDYPDHRILMTTMTPTGSAQVRALFGPQVEHCYVPYDLPGAVRRFLRRAHPRLGLVMETELWPNLFHQCRRRGIPLAVVNVRLSPASFRRYQKVRRLIRATLAQVSAFAVQSAADAERLRALGAAPERVRVTGSIKFDMGLPASHLEAAQGLRHQWGGQRPVWLAASTHEGEEEPVLAAYARLKADFPDLLLVLVPRHPERFAAVVRLCRRAGYQVARRSEQQGPLAPAVEILVGDTMGELQVFYAAADVAYVGGSLVPAGGHNLLEAAAVGVPAVFGPHVFNFAEISAMALERGAARQVADAGGLAAAVADLLGQPEHRVAVGEAGRRMVEENRGALDRTLAVIAGVLKAG